MGVARLRDGYVAKLIGTSEGLEIQEQPPIRWESNLNPCKTMPPSGRRLCRMKPPRRYEAQFDHVFGNVRLLPDRSLVDCCRDEEKMKEILLLGY